MTREDLTKVLADSTKAKGSIWFWQGEKYYLTLMRPDRGEISFLNEEPSWAPAKGSLPWLNSSRRLKLTKMPWAVSGLKKLPERQQMTFFTISHMWVARNKSEPILLRAACKHMWAGDSVSCGSARQLTYLDYSVYMNQTEANIRISSPFSRSWSLSGRNTNKELEYYEHPRNCTLMGKSRGQ